MKAEKFIKNWEKVRKRGMARHISGCSITMALSLSAGYVIVKLIKEDFSAIYDEYYMVLSYFAAGAIGGAIGALISWWLSAEKYNQLMNKNQ